VQGKLLREVYAVLGSTALKADMARLSSSLKRPGIKLNVRKVYGATFDALRNNLREVQATTAEIQSMLHATFRQLNAEHGFALQAPAEPDLTGFQEQLSQIENSHIHYLGIGNLLKLAQPDFCDKLVRALASRLRVVNEAAMTEVERWSKGAGAQLDAQLKERRRNFTKRIEAVERIQNAAGNLDERLAELATQEAGLAELHVRLREFTALLTSNEAPSAAAARSELSAA
jgi:small-conductance mechanosensitive channel